MRGWPKIEGCKKEREENDLIINFGRKKKANTGKGKRGGAGKGKDTKGVGRTRRQRT